MWIPEKFKIIALVLLCVWVPGFAWAALAPVAVFPLQELGNKGNDVNLPFTRALGERLAAAGNEISGHGTVIAFMANNRIRNVGHLETFHISRVRDELGSAFVLLGTVSQMKDQPSPSMGLTLQLVRTTDARTMWTYVGCFSAADDRKVLGIGEARSVADLQPLLLNDIVANWPWEIISEMQKASSISIDSIVLQPAHIRPGAEVSARVRLRNEWSARRAPRAFFKVDEQIHAATVADDGTTYEASWVAGEKDGRFPVNLLLEWPLYGRRETALLGSYLVDGTPPLFELELKGAQLQDGVPVFRNELVILPRMLVRKPLARWRLAFLNDLGDLIGAQEGGGNMPEAFVWQGRGNTGVPVTNGLYQVVLEAWDQAGNMAKTTRQVELNRSAPEVALAVGKNGREMVVDMEHDGKVPLAFWRMEMWTKEGRIIKMAEGTDLPAQVGFELTAAEEGEDIQGFFEVQDILGNRARRPVDELFLQAGKKAAEAPKEEKPSPLSETWVEEF